MRYRKKPVVIEAWPLEAIVDRQAPLEFQGAIIAKSLSINKSICTRFFIETLEGEMEVSKGDIVIKGIKGEFYPCKPDIFLATYEPFFDIED